MYEQRVKVILNDTWGNQVKIDNITSKLAEQQRRRRRRRWRRRQQNEWKQNNEVYKKKAIKGRKRNKEMVGK